MLTYEFPVNSHINTNCTTLIPPRNWILLLFKLPLLVPTPTSTVSAASDKITYFKDRNYNQSTGTFLSQSVKTYHEESKTQEAIHENTPFNPPSPALFLALTMSKDSHQSDQHCYQYADKFVASVCDKVEDLTLTTNAKKVTAELDGNHLENHDHECIGSSHWKIFRIEMSLNPRQECRQKNVCHKSHNYTIVNLPWNEV